MYDIVVFSHLRWNAVCQRPHHLLSRLARERRVFYVEEPERTSGSASITVSSPTAGVTVVQARTPVDATGFADAQYPLLEPLLRHCLADHDVRDAVAWFYAPMALPLLAAVPARAVVYDCMVALSEQDFATPQLLQREAELLRRADLVLTGGPGLFRAKRSRHVNVHCLPSPVDVAHFAPSAHRLDASVIAHPRLGFFGLIDERLDIALISRLAQAEPDWQIVMVGPVVKIDPATLPRAANIHWLGQQPYAALPALVQGWQVCLLPFVLNNSTRFANPTKTLEYMAAEKPVVSTAVNDVVTLYGDQIRVAGDTVSFIEMCRAALAEGTEQRWIRIATMRAAVARISWDRTVDALRSLVDAAAGEEAAQGNWQPARRWTDLAYGGQAQRHRSWRHF